MFNILLKRVLDVVERSNKRICIASYITLSLYLFQKFKIKKTVSATLPYHKGTNIHRNNINGLCSYFMNLDILKVGLIIFFQKIVNCVLLFFHHWKIKTMGFVKMLGLHMYWKHPQTYSTYFKKCSSVEANEMKWNSN